MRRVSRRLHQLFKARMGQDIQHQREQDGRGEHQQAIQIEGERVPYQSLKIVRGNKAHKIFQAHPVASRDALGKGVISEGDLHAIHRGIVEYGEKHQRWQAQRIKLPLQKKVPAEISLARSLHVHPPSIYKIQNRAPACALALSWAQV